jgi:glyoxalase-like protein
VRPHRRHRRAGTRLDVPAIPSSRVRPDGVELRWRLAGLPEAMAEPWLPFFISWEDMGAHPSTMPVSHRVEPQEIAWIEVGGDYGRLTGWLGGVKLPLRPGAESSVTAVSLAAREGEIVLGP